MADSLSQFNTRIRRYLREINADTSFWSKNFMNQLFNAQYRRRCAQLIMAHEGWFKLVAVTDLVEDKSRYAFPSGFQRLGKIELVRTDGSTMPLGRFERHASGNSTNSTADGDQYFPSYRMLGNGVILEPTPNATVEDGIQIEYYGLPAKLESDNDQIHISFPEIFDELLVIDTVVAAMQSEAVHEAGPVASILRLRAEWEADFDRFIDQRTISRQAVEPFVPHYKDS